VCRSAVDSVMQLPEVIWPDHIVNRLPRLGTCALMRAVVDDCSFGMNGRD
jgi:hypothetical protein